MSEGQKVPRIKFPKLKFTVVKQEGYCYHGYKPGDEFIFDDFTHPPQHFCSGLMKSAFPVCYALTFGSEFKFRDNMRSLEVTCPDNAKLTFKIEVLDDAGKVAGKPKVAPPAGPNPQKLVIEVAQVRGKCHYGYKAGDTIELTGLRTPQGFCGAAYSCLFPVLFAMNFGASFSFEKDPDCKTGIACPDGGSIIFKVRRKE
jgi:uncharacterized repeat protein (TIGR04076 family)